MIVDLHSHSNASDGDLDALDLLLRAREQGVQLMAITDHDTVAGYLAVREQWAQHELRNEMRLVAGVELSCQWSKRLIHVVGLNIDADNTDFRQQLINQQEARQQRARLIGDKLASYGFVGGYDYAKQLAGDSQIGRPHFARFLLEQGHVKSEKEAFKRYLGAGKPGDIKLTWPQLATVVAWIRDCGGVAVLAHPYHYKMTATKLRALISDFKAAGGEAIEVISGKQPKDRVQFLAQLATQFGLQASVGSDFHRPGMPWNELGQAGSLPSDCKPVWSQW